MIVSTREQQIKGLKHISEASRELSEDDNQDRYVTLFTDPAGFAGRLDCDHNLGIGLSTVLSAVEGGHPESVNTLTLRIQRLCVLNVT